MFIRSIDPEFLASFHISHLARRMQNTIQIPSNQGIARNFYIAAALDFFTFSGVIKIFHYPEHNENEEGRRVEFSNLSAIIFDHFE